MREGERQEGQPRGASWPNAAAGLPAANVTWTAQAPCRRGWQTKAAIHGSRAGKTGERRDKGRKAEQQQVKLWCPKHSVYEVRQYEVRGNATLGGIEAPLAPRAAAAPPTPAAVDVFLATKTFLSRAPREGGRPALEEDRLRYDGGSGYGFHRVLEYKLWARVIVAHISRDVDMEAGGAGPMPADRRAGRRQSTTRTCTFPS